MVEKLVKKAMKRSNAERFLPEFASAKKVIEEIAEHFSIVKWSLKRIILPVAVFYIIIGFFLEEHVLGALFTGFLVFLYTNFLPDLDAFFPHAEKSKAKKANWLEKRISLFFTPVVIYYILSRKLRPWDLGKNKPFHNKQALLEISVFLFFFGLLIYFSTLKALFFALFGALGFLTHLLVDKQLKF